MGLAERERAIGRHRVQEYTARRLAVQVRGRPLEALAALWGGLLLIVGWIAPWRGGTRALMAATVVFIAAVISLLVARFVPRRERFVVDLDAGEFWVESVFLIPPTPRTMRAPLAVVEKVRCRSQVWRDGPEAEAARWVLELVGEEGQTWRLAQGTEPEPMQELCRLVAEVSGRPLG